MSGNIPNHHGRAQLFQKFSFATIVVVFLLIAIGGIVRSSGAGMGCPDWPKCFDQWVPPTDVTELPANYQQIYQDRGYADTTFNAVKTWTEYLNRLFGVLTGFLSFYTWYLPIGLLNRLIQLSGNSHWLA